MRRVAYLPAYFDGHGLIELMISMTIGLLISGAAIGLFIASKSSCQLHHENGRTREEGQSALSLLGRNIVQAGYSPIAATTLTQPIEQAVYLSGPGIRGCDHGFAAASKGDFKCASDESGFPSIEMTYVVDSNYASTTGAGADCNGQEVKFDFNGNEFADGELKYAINRFYLAKKKGEPFATLYCSGNGNAAAQPILGDVENISLAYGLDITGDLVPDRYVTAAEVAELSENQAMNWKKVIDVTLCLQVAGSVRQTGNSAQKFIDCNGAEKSSNDNYLRHVFRVAFTLRNNAAPII